MKPHFTISCYEVSNDRLNQRYAFFAVSVIWAMHRPSTTSCVAIFQSTEYTRNFENVRCREFYQRIKPSNKRWLLSTPVSTLTRLVVKMSLDLRGRFASRNVDAVVTDNASYLRDWHFEQWLARPNVCHVNCYNAPAGERVEGADSPHNYIAPVCAVAEDARFLHLAMNLMVCKALGETLFELLYGLKRCCLMSPHATVSPTARFLRIWALRGDPHPDFPADSKS